MRDALGTGWGRAGDAVPPSEGKPTFTSASQRLFRKHTVPSGVAFAAHPAAEGRGRKFAPPPQPECVRRPVLRGSKG